MFIILSLSIFLVLFFKVLNFLTVFAFHDWNFSFERWNLIFVLIDFFAVSPNDPFLEFLRLLLFILDLLLQFNNLSLHEFHQMVIFKLCWEQKLSLLALLYGLSFEILVIQVFTLLVEGKRTFSFLGVSCLHVTPVQRTDWILAFLWEQTVQIVL